MGLSILREAFLRLCILSLSCALVSCLSSDQTTILRKVSTDLLMGGGSTWNTSGTDPCNWHGVVCNSDNVTSLRLQNQRLRGSISSSLGGLQALTTLDLSGNFLTGKIPDEISGCTSLSLLNLSSNHLSGPIPSLLQKLQSLEKLDLSANVLTGLIPDGLGNLHHLQELDLSSNNLTGRIPLDFGNLKDLQQLSLSQNLLNGTIPEAIGNLTALRRLSAYQNSLEGQMPQGSAYNYLEQVNLASNLLSGDIPKNICAGVQLQVLILTNNSFAGNLPEELSSCSTLTTLRVGHNLLNGSIPDGFGQLRNLIYFEADQNRLTGPIPSNISGWGNLSLLNLANNELTGNIPTEWSNVTTIQELHLSHNNLIGEIPQGLSRFGNLSVLDLSENDLTGNIPHNLCEAPKLQTLRLQGNTFAGSIPVSIGDCAQLLELQLGDNNFDGSIPSSIGSLSNLQVSLNLSMNELSGSIPTSLGSLMKLVSLDLSHNQLSGEIPSLADMISLLDWNFSNNLLSGPVPQLSPILMNSSSNNVSSYANNSGLCGFPLPSCGHNSLHSSKSKRSVSFWQVAGIAIACAIVALIIIAGIAVGVMYKHQLSSAVDPAPPLMVSRVFVESFEEAINFDSIKEATRSNANVVSSNHFSTIYKAVMPSGLVLAAKKLHSAEKGLVVHQRKMTFELDKLWRLSHDNIMRPLGYVLQNDLAILVYDFIPLCSLGQQLHRNSERLLHWPTRYDIALGAAQGLAFLHHACHPPMIHMDVTSNNVFLGPNFEVRVGDVEVAKLLDPFKNTGSISAVAGSFGYIAPEYAFTMRVTLASNVYSLGVVLLELVTGRLPIDETFGDGLDLVRWVHGASSRGETPEQILDARISALNFVSRQEMLAVLKVALLCTNASPSRRPRMKKVVEMLMDTKLPAEVQPTAN